MNEEEAEKTLVRAEIEANKALKILAAQKSKKKKKETGTPLNVTSKERVWFQSGKERKEGTCNL